jgi:hypothetical protein
MTSSPPISWRFKLRHFVGWGVGYGHYVVGWHGTSTVGSIGTAVGAASLLGLGTEGMVRALSIAVSLASGVKGQFGTPATPLHAGFATPVLASWSNSHVLALETLVASLPRCREIRMRSSASSGRVRNVSAVSDGRVEQPVWSFLSAASS